MSPTAGGLSGDSDLRDVTPDGRYVLFRGNAGINAYCACPSGACELYRRDRLAGVTVHVSANAAGQAGTNGVASGGTVSDDGRWAAFTSAASNLVAGDTNGVGIRWPRGGDGRRHLGPATLRSGRPGARRFRRRERARR